MGDPQNGWFMREIPIKMDDLGLPYCGTLVAVRWYQIANCKQSPANGPPSAMRKKAPHSIAQTLRHCSLVKLGWCTLTIDPIKCSSGILKDIQNPENTEQILCRDGSIVFSFGFFVVQALAVRHTYPYWKAWNASPIECEVRSPALRWSMGSST